jgi:hypothetical protein
MHFNHRGLSGRRVHESSCVPSKRGGVARACIGFSYEDPTGIDFSRVLGVHPNASKREVKTAYRRLALRFHPDVCTGEECDTRFMEVNRAYESLMISCPQSPTPQAAAAAAGDAFSRSANCNPGGQSWMSSMHYGFQETEPVPAASEDDPWADFLQSIKKGTYEDLREDNTANNFCGYANYASAGRSSGSTSTRPEGNW